MSACVVSDSGVSGKCSGVEFFKRFCPHGAAQIRCYALNDIIRRTAMTDHHTYKKVELVGSSATSIDDAITNAIDEAAKSIKHMEWFEVLETRGHIKDGKV